MPAFITAINYLLQQKNGWPPGNGLRLLLLTAACLLGSAPTLALTAASDNIHQQALTAARSGNYKSALTQLRTLSQRYPKKVIYLYDYITVLGWAEKDTEVLAKLPLIKLDKAPNYVLETLGKSARNLKRYPLSIHIYRAAVHNNPDRIESILGLILSLADNGQQPEAAVLTAKLQRQPASAKILNTRAYTFIKQKKYFRALDAYQQTLKSEPNNRQARKGVILLTARLGAPHLAADMATKAKGLFTTTELEAIDRDKTAMAIRWGRLPGKKGAPASSDTDNAIHSLEKKLQPSAVNNNDPRKQRKLRYDLIEALYDSQRYIDVIAVYAALLDTEESIPDNVLVAVASSYLQLKAPARAISLLRQIAQRQKDNFTTRLTLVYALVDNEQFDEAQAMISRMAAEEPVWKKKTKFQTRKKNPKKFQANVTAAMIAAFADDLEEAQSEIQTLLTKAPNNSDLRTDLGYIYLWRGLPQSALREFNIAHIAEPDFLPPRQGQVSALFDLSAFRHSQKALQKLATQQPLNAGVKKLQRAWQLHRMHELRLSTGYGLSSGNQAGSKDFNLDASLYSRPLNYRYRPFIYSHYATAKFPEGRGQYRRLGIGTEYRQRQLTVTSMLTFNSDGIATNGGLSLNALWLLTDHWRLGAGYDSNSNGIPLRGRLNEQIDGWSVNMDVSYYFHESRRIDSSLQTIHFSDGNTRQSFQATLFQRLITRPHYKLDGSASLYTSTNNRLNAPYFNPEQDLNLNLSVINEWLLYRYYERSFRHRLGISLGSYSQKNFGGSISEQIFYEHQWNPDDTFEITYGISLANKTYDGLSEYQSRLYLTLDWLF